MAGFRWRVLYKLPLPKRAGDLQWRVIHGALATNTFLSKMDVSEAEGCVFCSSPETVIHAFAECSRLTSALALLDVLCGKLGVVFLMGLYILGPMYSVRAK